VKAVIRRFPAAVWTLVVLLAASVAAGSGPTRVLPTPAELQRTVNVLAAPDLAGRRSGTPQGDRAARELAGWLAAAGLRPGGDAGGFLQSFVLERTRVAAPASVLSRAAGAGRLALGTDWTPHGGSRTGEVTGEPAFAGHGASAGDYTGLDVRGKVVLALAGRASRLEKLILARERHAAALLIVAEPLPSLDATGSPVDLVSGTVTPAAAEALRAAPRVRLRVEFTTADVTASNAIGLLPGTDPRLAAEAVVLGAHYDHVGVIGGAVHPGADDNASGTAVVLGSPGASPPPAGRPARSSSPSSAPRSWASTAPATTWASPPGRSTAPSPC
jgi:aminopeptidase YwaD